MSADSKLDGFPGEKPLASDVLDWLRLHKPRLTSDQRALADGYSPRALLAYSAASVPAALVADATTGITPAMVANREVVRMAKLDDNAKLLQQRTAHEAELRNGFFEIIAESLVTKAPLLLSGLRTRHAQAAPFASFCDGQPAWAELVAMSATAAQLPGESGEHAAFIMYMDLLTCVHRLTTGTLKATFAACSSSQAASAQHPVHFRCALAGFARPFWLPCPATTRDFFRLALAPLRSVDGASFARHACLRTPSPAGWPARTCLHAHTRA